MTTVIFAKDVVGSVVNDVNESVGSIRVKHGTKVPFLLLKVGTDAAMAMFPRAYTIAGTCPKFTKDKGFTADQKFTIQVGDDLVGNAILRLSKKGAPYFSIKLSARGDWITGFLPPEAWSVETGKAKKAPAKRKPAAKKVVGSDDIPF